MPQWRTHAIHRPSYAQFTQWSGLHRPCLEGEAARASLDEMLYGDGIRLTPAQAVMGNAKTRSAFPGVTAIKQIITGDISALIVGKIAERDIERLQFDRAQRRHLGPRGLEKPETITVHLNALNWRMLDGLFPFTGTPDFGAVWISHRPRSRNAKAVELAQDGAAAQTAIQLPADLAGR